MKFKGLSGSFEVLLIMKFWLRSWTAYLSLASLALADIEYPKLSRSENSPILRVFGTEGSSVVVELESVPNDSSTIQWMRNGVPLGQTSNLLVLPQISTATADIYYAVTNRAGVTSRSQSALVLSTSPHRLANCSLRGLVTSSFPLIAGFVVKKQESTAQNTRFLIRVVGPSLTKFGIANPLANPSAILHGANGLVADFLPSNPNSSTILEAEAKVGAFSLVANASDFTATVILPPGAFTVVATGPAAQSGEALIEVYEIPNE